MRILGLILACTILFTACDLNKYTKVYIDNQNSYPIDVKIETANVISEYRVERKASLDTLRQFTDIEFVDGTWKVTIKNANTGKGKTYEHGNFYQGELDNLFSIKTKGSYVEFSVDM